MSWNRRQSINPECHFKSPKEGTLSQNSLLENRAKVGFATQRPSKYPNNHFQRKKQFPIRLQGRRKVPRLSFPSLAAPKVFGLHQFFSAPCFFQFCVQYGKLLDGVVHGWTVFLARDNGTWGSQGCFLSLLSEGFTLVGPGRTGHLGPRLAQNTPLTVPSFSRVDSK